MDVGIFGSPRKSPYCIPCYEDSDDKHYMEKTEAYSSTFGGYVSAWRCPNCDRTVMRDEGDSPTVTNPDGEIW